MDDHQHNISVEAWPFDDPVNHAAFTTRYVAHDNYPVLVISHDDNGDWQFLCGTTTETEDAVLHCLGCMYERYPYIGEFADLPRGYLAWRDSEADPWQIEKQAQGEDE